MVVVLAQTPPSTIGVGCSAAAGEVARRPCALLRSPSQRRTLLDRLSRHLLRLAVGTIGEDEDDACSVGGSAHVAVLRSLCARARAGSSAGGPPSELLLGIAGKDGCCDDGGGVDGGVDVCTDMDVCIGYGVDARCFWLVRWDLDLSWRHGASTTISTSESESACPPRAVVFGVGPLLGSEQGDVCPFAATPAARLERDCESGLRPRSYEPVSSTKMTREVPRWQCR